MTDNNEGGAVPQIERIRYETVRRRTLLVKTAERITPNMLRLTMTGENMSDFSSLGVDDHIKIVVSDADGNQVMRDYTPRRYDTAARELVVDFALHDAGPATLWALSVKPGDAATIAGPRGSQVVGGDIRNWLLIGDETGLPAIGRRIEELGADAQVTTLVAVPSGADEQVFASDARVTSHWIYRPVSSASDPAPFIARLGDIEVAPQTYVWVAAEARVARAVRTHLTQERGLPLPWLKARGYWVIGSADSTEEFD